MTARAGREGRIIDGVLVLQDHRPDVDPKRRLRVKAARVASRDQRGRIGLEGYTGADAAEKTGGDLGLGSILWPLPPVAPKGQPPGNGQAGRGSPAWFFAAPAVGSEPVLSSVLPPARRPGQPIQAPANVVVGKFKPAGDGRLNPDTRFADLVAGLAPATRLPAGWPSVVIGATDDDAQRPLAFPASGPIVAVHKAGDPRAARLVVDLDTLSRVDPARAAEFHRLARVVMLDGGKCGLTTGPTLATRHGFAVDGAAGLGLIDGLAGGSSLPQAPVAEDAKSGDQKASGDLTTRTRDAGSQPRDGVVPFGEGMPRPGSQARVGKDLASGVRLQPATVVAALAAWAGGPIDLGGAGDVHRLGTTLDGEPVNAAHISTQALFRTPDGSKDAPIAFQEIPYVEPPAFPYTSRVHLRYDPAVPHQWPGGGGPGLWRLLAELPFYMEEPPPHERWDPPPPKDGDPPPPGDGTPWVPPPIGNPPTGPKPPRPQTGGGSSGSGPSGTGSLGGNYTPEPIPEADEDDVPPDPEDPESIFGDDFTTDGGTQFGPPDPIFDGDSFDPLTGTITGPPPVGDPEGDEEGNDGAAVDPGASYPATSMCMILGGNVWFRAMSGVMPGTPNLTTPEGIAAAGGPAAATAISQGQPVVTQLVPIAGNPTQANPQPRTDGTTGPAAASGAVLVAPPDVDPVKVAKGETTESPSGLVGTLGLPDGMGQVQTGVVSPTTKQLQGGTTWSADGKVITFDSGTHTFEVDLASGEARMDGVPLGTGGGGSAGALPGGTGADGSYDPADAASLATGLPNYDNFTLQAGRTIKGNAGQFHYVQVAGSAALNGTINLDGRGNEGGNGGAGGASSAAGNGTAGTAGSVGTGTSAATAGGGARGGGSGSGDGGTRSGGNGGTGGNGGNRGAPWSADGQGTGGAGTAGSTGAGSAGTLGGNATAVDPTLLARRVSHDFLVALLGGAGGGGGGGGGGYAAGTVVAAGGAGASTYADADGTGEDGADGTFSIDSSGGGGGGKGGRGGGVYVMVVRHDVSGTFTINARGAQGGNGGVGNATGGDGGAGGGGGGGFVLIVFYGTWSATLTCNVGGGDSPAGQGAGEDGFYAVVNGSTGEVVQWGGSLASIAERTSALVAVQPTVSAAPADPLVATAPTTIVPVDTSGGAFPVELPPADSVEVGDSVVLKDAGGAATANPLTVDANAADTIDGGASTSLGVDSGAITIQKITANTWMIV